MPSNLKTDGKGQVTRGPGRPKGSPNKQTVEVKQAIAEAAAQLGGTNRLVAWAKEDPANERTFWGSIYPKLLPLTVHGSGADGEHLASVRVEFVNGTVPIKAE